MKTNLLIVAVLTGTILFNAGCVKEGTPGRDGVDGQDGNANVIYSPWYTPNDWAGETRDWYFQVSNSQISEDVVEAGVILAYVSVPGDIYEAAVRPLPAYAIGANWDYLIPYYGTIEFTSDALIKPGTNGYYFRFVIIPSSVPLKSGGNVAYTEEQLRKMNYLEVCKTFRIPE
jgi:hypothetical protein